MLDIQRIYEVLPIGAQNLACTFQGWKEKRSRLGGNFIQHYEYLKKTEWYSEEQIKEYQNIKLQKIIRYSYLNIPYYKKLFDYNQIDPNSIKAKDDLVRIPILDKETVRSNYKELINEKIDDKLIYGHTSGSTGKSLKLLFTQEAIRYRWALWFRHKNRFGITPYDPHASFTGKVAVPIKQNKPPYWRENKAMKQVIFTMHHINEKTVFSIVDRLNKGGLVYYTGYPSIIYRLAQLIEENKLKITKPPKIVITGAESLLDIQKKLISKVFRCPVTDQYGFSEGCGNASRCKNGLFHEDFEYGILECHNPITNADGSITGEILATGFTNYAMPLIRYKVGDTATWIDNNCSCGRKSKTIREINGRSEDYVITPEGNKILRFDYVFKDAVNIVEAQVVQKKLGEIIIRVVKRTTFSEKDENLITKEIYSKISPKLIVNFEYPSQIEREQTGKFRAVKSFL